jgi:DegV family protein with EDD domain
VLPLYINIGDEEYQDGVDISRQEFYSGLPGYPVHPTTAVPGIGRFLETFHKLVDEGATEILSIHISESLSAVLDVARSATRQFTRIPVTVFDSRQLSMGTGFQVETAARLAGEGRSLPEIISILNDMIGRTRVVAALDTLEFLRRSGRMNRFMTGLGSLLRIKPILKMFDGQPVSERVRTTGKAMNRTVELLQKQAPIERFALLHTNARGKAELFHQKIAHLLPEKQVSAVDITPVIGAHIGPGAVGFAVITRKS